MDACRFNEDKSHKIRLFLQGFFGICQCSDLPRVLMIRALLFGVCIGALLLETPLERKTGVLSSSVSTSVLPLPVA